MAEYSKAAEYFVSHLGEMHFLFGGECVMPSDNSRLPYECVPTVRVGLYYKAALRGTHLPTSRMRFFLVCE